MGEQMVNPIRLRTFTKSTLYIACPACSQGAHTVSHKMHGGGFGPWYCDECGQGFRGRTISGAEAEVELVDSRVIKTVVTLRLDPDDAPITLIVEGIQVLHGDEQFDPDRDEYFYNEHTCPINFLPKVAEVIDDEGNNDPHGVFRWVKTELATKDAPA